MDESLSLDAFDVCRPFFEETGLNAFSYSRLFKDGMRSEVWSDAAAFDHTFNKARYIVGAYTPKYFAQDERYSVLEKKVETYPKRLCERYRNQLVDQREYFDHDNCFAILNHEPEFCEYFIFYAPRSNIMAVNFYLNNIDRLEKFSSHFLQSAGTLIERADRHRIRSVRNAGDMWDKNQSLAENLTSREKDVAKLVVTGATIKEIGVALGISPRTVESHVENLKLKLGCVKKSALIKQLYAHKGYY